MRDLGASCRPPTWRSPTVNVQFRAEACGFSAWRVRRHFGCHQSPLPAAQPLFSYGMNEIRYLKSHSFAVLIAEPTQIYKKRDVCKRRFYGKQYTDCIMQPVVFNKLLGVRY